MKTFKKILKYFFISMAAMIVLLIHTVLNLENNYVYYFQQSKETNKEGIPFVLVDHLDKYTQPKFEEDGNYIYDMDGEFSIKYTKKDKIAFELRQEHFKVSYILVLYDLEGDRDILHGYDNDFRLTQVYDLSGTIESPLNYLPITAEKEKETQEIINLLTQPLLERVEPPAINLQWLYDKIDYWSLERDWMWQWLE